MANFPRSRRIADQIQRDLSDILRRDFRDPRLGMVTITDVDVSRDFSHATIYISSLQGNEVLAASVTALSEGAGYLRSLLGKRLSLRVLPQLHFVADTTLDRAISLSSLIDQAIADDSKHPKD
ncbi:30S ribosome-binding factor RbfA [Ferrovum sp. PN-J185]|uniref:30S ribosome-binding factor RbfA n=1 Tax=Ferrovum sp. PN-J185 TaxID=1356306 RepID=UPI00079182D4|nr:30S ribosome-binding factor RbfA [Ferrovum sp. PN-J185]KXW55194.1 ribosome-binding factor A [Ferrovum sp. PN-J185]MCC6069321.1 30S ribosome-binding factor RbfA [Ferrovum sp. PN-J185]MDE1891559.1 30S ribosome-binding factor RbfA [Betaproteobacteria bacterium]MDE2055893.1 30S ribosome-binding factor RbfA [Betaproteobacteria bacterium]